MIAAVGRNGVIGDGTTMPWHVPEDLKFFKRTTMGHAMIMGRRTFDSMGALPGRRSIVITRQPEWWAADAETAHSLSEALALVGPAAEVFIAGGGEIYRMAMPLATRLLITEMPMSPEGTVTFPAIGAEWVETDRRSGEQCEWVTYELARDQPNQTMDSDNPS